VSEALFVAASVLVPLVFGLIPAFLPTGVPVGFRWLLWFVILALTSWYVHLLREAPSPYPLLALAILVVSAALSLVVLIVETARQPRLRVHRPA
jgi:cytochrome bd-type quinol oxidase subunit 2